MRRKMFLITILVALGFGISLSLFLLIGGAVFEAIAITFGVTLYHFLMRLAVGMGVDLIMKNKANHKNAWFREKRFEAGLYRVLRVCKWKKHLPTYSPDTFDTSQKTVGELVGATCQAELVHEIIMLLSLLPIAFIPLLGGAAAMIITSVLAMAFDSLFVIIQRYNRPRLVKIMTRFQSIK